MTPEEIARLLGTAASFDLRTIGRADVAAWQLALNDLDYDDALASVVGHYRDSRERLMPADVRKRVKAIRKDRLDRQVTPAPDPDHPAAYRAGLRRAIREQASRWSAPRALPPRGHGAPPTADYLAERDSLAGRDSLSSGNDRDLVLARTDLANRLTQPPLGYARPEQWNGYIPPGTFGGIHNDSPRRAALLDIVAEARRRNEAEEPTS